MRISDSEKGQAWLSQFRAADVPLATRLLDTLLFVSTAEFRNWMAGEILREAAIGRLALYGEREFPPLARFFNTLQPGKVKRAIGRNGPALVQPTRGSVYVGSEGIVAQLISELAQRRDVDALLTPGPDRLRPIKSRGPTQRLAIVTDLIGSGNRIYRMLNAMWRTESVRSWHSHRKVKLEVLVFTYASSIEGKRRVEKHRLRPRVIVRHVAPTLNDVDDDLAAVKALCRFYAPKPKHSSAGALGYGDAGTLVAFGHGCPNTAPPMLWHRGRSAGHPWEPLFPERSGVAFDLLEKPAEITVFRERLLSLGLPTLADPGLLARFPTAAREALLVLAAVSHGLRDDLGLASRTGLEVARVDSLLVTFRSAGWIGASNSITAKGLAELRAAAGTVSLAHDIPIDGVSVYFPSSLRG